MTDKNVYTFLQLNAWSGRLFYPLAALLEREKPEIASMQEILSGPGSLNTDYITLEAMLARGYFSTAARGGAMPWLSRRNNGYSTQCVTLASTDVAVVDEKRTTLYQNEKDDLPFEADDARYSGLLHTTLRLHGGETLHVLNHHGRLVINGRMGHDIGDYNFCRIAEYAAVLDGPVILSGDFNLYRQASSLRFLQEAGLVNLNDTFSIDVGRNEFSWKPDEIVCHIFVSRHVHVEDYRVLADNVSDHLPLRLKFSLRP